MPRYIIERNVPNLRDMTAAEKEAASRKSIEVADQMPGMVWVKSYISEVEGKIYCEYEAPNPEAVLEHARRVGMPADKISEITMEVSPEMFV
jgi:hypothetical protein